jgi:hypothetical protein
MKNVMLFNLHDRITSILSLRAVAFSERRQMKTFKLFLAQYLPLGGASATLLALLGAACLWLSAPKTVFAQNTVQRDQQALAILTQTIAAAGGQQSLASIQDFIESGTIAFNFSDSDPVTGGVTVKSRGLHQLRIDAELPEGRRTTVVNGKGGSLIEADGRTRPIYRQSAKDLGSLTLPYLPLIAAVQDSSTSIIYGGLVTHNGATVYDVRLQKTYTKQQDPSGTEGVREASDFYIDSNTLLVAAVFDRILFDGGHNDQGVPHEVLYSNYQPENGIMAPLTIVETVRGETGFTMTLSQVTFNSGLADSDFAW